MPRPDGKLYNWEKPTPGKAVASIEAQIPKPKPVPVKKGRQPHPLSIIKKGGRPKTIQVTQALIDGACQDIANGLGIESALVLQGISRSAVDKWKKVNPSVSEALERAETSWERGIVGNIQRMTERDLKAGSFLLERKLARRWAPLVKSEVSGPNGEALRTMTLSKTLLASVSADADMVDRPAKPARKVSAVDI